jgi:signal transduction histidine kinase
MKIDLLILSVLMVFPVYFMGRILNIANKKPIHLSFFSFMLCITIWYLGDILLVLFPGNANREDFFWGIFYTGLILVPPTFLITSLTFNNDKFKFRLSHLLLFIIPLLSIGLIWTNPAHHLFFIKNSIISSEIVYGPYFYYHMVYSYLCLNAAYIVFLRSSIKSSGLLSHQSILLFLGGVIPYVVNFALTVQIINVNVNATLIAISAMMLCSWIAIFKYDFLNIIPIAIKKVMDNISDAFMVIDRNNQLLDFNRAFSEDFSIQRRSGRRLFPERNVDLKRLFDRFDKAEFDFNQFNACMQKSIAEQSVFRFEKYFPSLDRYFVVELNPIFLKNNYLGTVVLLKDITEYQKMLAKMKSQNEELTIVNEQLADYVATVKELTLEKERNRIETEIHNLMGHNLNVLLRLIEVCKITMDNDPDKTLATILDAEQIIKNTMNNVREIAKEIGGEAIAQNSTYKNSALSYLEVLFNNFRRTTDVNVEYSFEGDFSDLDRSLIRIIYNICQEAMTNSLKHGKAKMITIFLKRQQHNLFLSILDDGSGCANIQKSGMGLRGMQEMVRNYNGNIEFKSDENDGFKISVTIPIKGEAKIDKSADCG